MKASKRASESDGGRMGPDEAGNVRAAVSRVVTCSQAVKQENSAMWKCADGLGATRTRPYIYM